MRTITTIGLDIAKSVFQFHGVDAGGQVIIRRQLKRRYVLAFFQKLPSCLVGIEACASAHHWSRELQALGHTVRLMPPAYVKPYVKRHKNDAQAGERRDDGARGGAVDQVELLAEAALTQRLDLLQGAERVESLGTPAIKAEDPKELRLGGKFGHSSPLEIRLPCRSQLPLSLGNRSRA